MFHYDKYVIQYNSYLLYLVEVNHFHAKQREDQHGFVGRLCHQYHLFLSPHTPLPLTSSKKGNVGVHGFHIIITNTLSYN